MINGYITLKDASELSGKEVEALKKQCQEGRIRGAIKQGKVWFVPRSEILVDDSVKLDGTLGFVHTFIEAAGDSASVGVTVVAGGRVISGQMISRKEYLSAFRNNFKQALPFEQDSDNPLYDVVDQYMDNLEQTKEEGLPGFIHLKNYSISGVNNGYRMGNSYIRVKYSSIDAFTLGEHTKE